MREKRYNSGLTKLILQILLTIKFDATSAGNANSAVHTIADLFIP